MNGPVTFWTIILPALLEPGIIEAIIGAGIVIVGAVLDSKRFAILCILVNVLIIMSILGAK